MTRGSARKVDEFTAARQAYEALRHLEPAEQSRALRFIAEKLDVPAPEDRQAQGGQHRSGSQSRDSASTSGVSERAASPKAFLAAKKPQTDVEQVACLAYYLTHSADTSTFGTKDLTKANHDALAKSINMHRAVDNANKGGYLAPAGKGQKGITALGEAVVQAMPDREAVKAAIAEQAAGKRRWPKRGGSRKPKAGKP
jgi:hypothetical protein